MELKDEILEKMVEKASQLFSKPAGDISTATNFINDLKAKSVDLVKIIAVLEDEFGIDVNFMNFRKNATFGEAAEYVASLR